MNQFPLTSRLLVIAHSLLVVPLMAQSVPPNPAAVPPPGTPLKPAAPQAVPQKTTLLTTPPTAPVAPSGSISKSGMAFRYELGPGDELNFGIYGKPSLDKKNVPVAPDGTISFLQARQVPVLGRTLDEVRVELRKRLESYHREAMVIVTPAKLGSRTYTILGEVGQNGSYVLNRPTTLLEALAQAKGFTVGSLGDDASELADLRRSFVVRGGKKLDVDLEALYLRGDFAQNIMLQPDDYIHIASLVRNEIFVLGKVGRPGVYPIRNGMTAMGAVAAAGGFSKVAWRNRVLVVRGKMHNPELHVVELNKTIHGRGPDMEIQPGDLVFVSLRPWAYPAQILDAALRAYIDGTVAGLLAEEDGSIGFSVGPSL